MISTPQMYAAVAFAVVLMVVLVPYWMFIARREEASRVTLWRRIQGAGQLVRRREFGVARQIEQLSSFGPLNDILRPMGVLTRPLQTAIQRSGVQISVGGVVLASAALAALFGVMTLRATGLPVAALFLGLAGLCLPIIVLRVAQNKRLRKFEEQFPEAVDLIARSLRAGHALPTSLRLASEELPEPLSGEFKRLHDHQAYGLPLPDALKDLANRLPLIDARFFVTALLTQREAGGNLAEVLDNLALVIRERFKIQRQLRVRAAHGRMTGLVLGGLPPVMGLILAYRAPQEFSLLFTDPLGVRMLTVAVILQVVGVLLIRKITNVEY